MKTLETRGGGGRHSLNFIIRGFLGLTLLGGVFLLAGPTSVSAAGTPCSITPIMTETDLNTCIAEAPTDNSEFGITIGANFNITAVKNIVAGKNITLASVNPASPATLARDPGFVGRIFSIDVTAPSVAVLTLDSVVIDGGNPVAAPTNGLIYTVGTGDVTVNLVGNTVLKNNNSTTAGGAIYINSTSHKLNIQGNAQVSNNITTGGNVYVRGIFTMTGGTISGNTTNGTGSGAGVVVGANAVFNMSGGEISGNMTTGSGGGGGVYVYDASDTFNMSGGKITGNIAQNGGGVFVGNGATFNMSGGEISGNTTRNGGGGVRVGGAFNMTGGIISGNTANCVEGIVGGGGVSLTNAIATFNMTGGEVSGNTSMLDGGGIWVAYENLANLTIGAGVVFSGNSASVATRMNPTDQALYDAQIFATSFSLPLPFNGYNNFDISYESDLPTDICQYTSSLWADDAKCVSVPGTGLFGGLFGGANNATGSLLGMIAAGSLLVVVLAGRKVSLKLRR